jgi:hypothetical protein
MRGVERAEYQPLFMNNPARGEQIYFILKDEENLQLSP